MENKTCGKCGMVESRKTTKHQGFKRALSILTHYSAENTPVSLPIRSSENRAHQTEPLNVGTRPQMMIENLRHNSLR